MKFYVPGVDLPDEIYKRMKNADDPKKTGYEIALEIIKELKNLKGLHGIHITALFWEDIIPFLVKDSDLLPRS
jgi:methylenetetrahydrofolate reductase (NADPH)